MQLETTNQIQLDMDYLFSLPRGKFNTNIVLNPYDLKNNTRVLCKEPYAQSLYDKYIGGVSDSKIYSKDLELNGIYTVRIIKHLVDDDLFQCEEILSHTLVYVNISDVKNTDIINNLSKPFKVILTRNVDGVMYGSIKKYKSVASVDILNDFLINNEVFEVKIKKLIKRGFIVEYDNSIECFLPGALAAPNVIYDFESYIGKTLKVMVENYDTTYKTFIVSHKKYIQHILVDQIKTLEYGKMYQGVVTSTPTKFGIFVEFDGIFTGLINITEFSDYESYIKNIKCGDTINFYIKKIVFTDKSKYRINLTTDLDKVDPVNITWSEYKRSYENKTFDYSYSIDDSQLKLYNSSNKEVLSINVDHSSVKDFLDSYKKIKIFNIDVIDRNIQFEFC
jgi:predicted RNA-binding protein with RPS1 domain